VLGLDRVGIHDNFFHLGGDSLDVIKVTSRIAEALQADVPPPVVFRARTVARLAAALLERAAPAESLPEVAEAALRLRELSEDERQRLLRELAEEKGQT
jgi:acyl carrier protein